MLEKTLSFFGKKVVAYGLNTILRILLIVRIFDLECFTRNICGQVKPCPYGYLEILFIKSIPKIVFKTKAINKTMNNNQPDEFMQAAIAEAKQGLNEGGIPIGSVIVRDGIIVGRGHNRRVQHNDPMAHAEIDCLQNAGRIGNYKGTTLYSTLMPCYLC